MEKITEGVIEKLIHRELEKGEKELMELFRAVEMGKMSQEKFKDKSRVLQGYGVWWGSESSHSLSKVKVNYIKKLEEDLYEISATCEMYYESGHVYWEEDGTVPEYADKPRKSAVKMIVNGGLEVKEFDFQWI
ncbi:MAG: hypothetical protein SCAL_000068 [Candidatus Syntrophoarchaeum caldarius]|uniref:Uncharacterized protein n=1 Tax=Candidatus Syntropharchaeum caldarium TaxID=1838285 RepID=A0A1F2PBX0_9EURY|nr:MAG: hypothetical protein SCAL_000068 [Candidatus Syntrophoarchaeum caldarius]